MHKTYMLSHVCANVHYISIYVSHMPYTSVNFFQCHGNTETSRYYTSKKHFIPIYRKSILLRRETREIY